MVSTEFISLLQSVQPALLSWPGTDIMLIYILLGIIAILLWRMLVARRKSLHELESNRNFLLEAQQMGKIGSYELDFNLNKYTWTEEFYKLWGYDHDTEINAESFRRKIHPDDLNRVNETISNAIEHGTPYEIEFRVVPREGVVRNVWTRGKVIYDNKHRPVRFVGSGMDITEQVNTKRELERSRQFLQSIIDNIPVGILVRGATDMQILLENKALAQIAGVEEEYTKGKTFEHFAGSVFSKEALELSNATDREIVKTKKTVTIPEYPLLTSKGKRILRTVKLPITNDEGQVCYILGISEDITEQYQFKKELEESQLFLKTIIENLPVGVLVRDAKSRAVLIENKALGEISGHKDQVLGKRLDQIGDDFLNDEALRISDETDRQLIETKQPVFIPEYPFNGLKGPRTFRATKAPVFDHEGNLVYILSIVEDITDSLKAQRELDKSRRFLEESQAMGKVGSFERDLIEGKVTCSKEFREIYAIDEKQEILYDDLLNRVHPDDKERVLAASKEAVANKTPYDIEYRIVHPSGEQRMVWVKGNAIYDEEGKPVRFSGVTLDITQRKEAEEKLAQHSKELARSNEDLEQFAYTASHDLKEPLRTITGFLKVLQDKYKDKLDADANEYIAFAVDGATRMGNLIQGLLDYARVTTRGQAMQPTDLKKVMNDVIQNLHESITEHHAQVIVDTELPTVNADELQMMQLLQNLISNALKFHKDQDPEIHIRHTFLNGHPEIIVKDNGIGIPENSKERIFQIFQRLHSSDEYEGTGVGLAVSKKIVERHGGKIWVESEEGKGSEFHFSLS